MYVQHFGLKKRLFRANPAGTDVFVGPQTVTAIAGLKTALQTNDSIVTVHGPVGSGKTTMVARALESIGEDRIVVKISRMRLNSDDVLEHLLAELDVDEVPGGTIRKFTALRKRLKDLEDARTRVFVVVEDAVRLGADTLAELEAVTAGDAGESDGASLVLMGDERIVELWNADGLTRLLQRIRQKHLLAPLCAAELKGYLRHCFRLADGDFEQAFEAGSAELLHHLSGGVLRTANNLVESVLSTAATQDIAQVPTALLKQVAEKEYGLGSDDLELPVAAEPSIAEPPDDEPVAEPAETRDVEDEPVIVFAENSPESAEKGAPIPELIQDTLPDLEVLAPEFANTAPEVRLVESEPDVPEIPELSLREDVPVIESDGNGVAEWDRDPTLAELKPDLEALEKAMAVAHGGDAEPPLLKPEAEPVPAPEPEPQTEAPAEEDIPEITLDNAINRRIEQHQTDEPDDAGTADVLSLETSNSDAAEVERPAAKDKKADIEIQHIAAELAKAKSIEDVDDKLAETLFGEEINLAASQVLANPPVTESANDEIETAVTPEPTVADSNGTAALSIAAEPAAASVEVTLGSNDGDDDFDPLSASQRLKTVRALNADLHPSLREPQEPAANEPQEPADSVDSIEDQINTSMTHTLKTLKIDPPVDDDEDDDDEQVSKGGFFSRFRRS